jgi:hypothetical protein
MKKQWMVYLAVFALVLILPFAPVELTGIIIFLQFFIGLTQVIGSISRYIYKLIKYKLHDKTILTYWIIIVVYSLFLVFIYYFYLNRIPSFLYDMKRNITFFVYLMAIPIAVWYLFNISFLKIKDNESSKVSL